MTRQLIAAALLIPMVAGCGDRSDTPPAANATVVIGVLSDVQGWNPYLTETAHSEDVLRLIYPSLAVEQVDYRDHPPTFTPSLASSWQHSEDRLSLDVVLDERAVWSDGTPVTSADVLYSHRTQTSPEVGWPDMYIKDYISSVEAVDARTVRYTFTHVYPYQMMDVNDGLIIPAHAWSEIPYSRWRDTDWSQKCLSAGPFQLSSHVPQQEVVLAANPRYWVDGRPRLENVVWRVVPNQGNLLTQLRTGAIDFMKGVPPRDAERIRDDPKLDLVSFPDRGYGQIIWNLEKPLFADVRVRRALTMAINRDAIIENVYRGFARPAVGPILSGMWAFNAQLEPLPYSPEAAKKLLAEAGWSDHDGDGIIDRDGKPFAFELMSNSENQTRQDICVLVQKDLDRVGIRAELRFVEWGTQLASQRSGSFDAAVHRWLEPTQIDLEEVWHTADPEDPGANYARYSNPEVDRLLELAGAATDAATQKPLFDRIQEIIVDEQPYTFLVESIRLDGLSTRVEGAVINDATPYFNLDEWYVTGAAASP